MVAHRVSGIFGEQVVFPLHLGAQKVDVVPMKKVENLVPRKWKIRLHRCARMMALPIC